MNIQTNDEKNTIPVTEDDDFSYDGYQVVRGEFFAHTYEPSFTFNSSKVSGSLRPVNPASSSACAWL